MTDILERIAAAKKDWREEIGSTPDRLYLGRQEWGHLKKAIAIDTPGVPTTYDGMLVVRTKRLQQLQIGRDGPLESNP